MPKEQLLYSKTSGLNVQVRPECLQWKEDGSCELAKCDNVLITPEGKLERAVSGTVLVSNPGVVHTLYDKERKFYGVGTSLYEVVNGASVLVSNNRSGNPIVISVYGGVAYCYDGVNFFTVKADRTLGAWAFTSKKGAVTTKVFAGPSSHSKSVVGWGRIFTLHAGVVFFSEPIGPTMFDYANNVMMDSNPIQDFAAVKGLMVVATSKTVYALVGEDFKQATRKPLFTVPAIANTVVSGVTEEGLEVVCFTTANGMYAVAADGNVLELTAQKVPVGQFSGTFVGASCVYGRYTIYNSGNESYSITLATKALERHPVQYTKVNGVLVYDGDLKVLGTVQRASGILSEVTFPSLDFGTLLNKSYRSLRVGGFFAGESTWTFSDEHGNTFSKTIPATGTTKQFFKVHATHKVCGQYITVNVKTNSDFRINSIHALPVLKVS